MALVGNTTEEKIWNYLKSQGFNNYGVAGIMGNLYAESGLQPNNLQNTYEKSLGYSDSEYTKAIDNGSYTNFVYDSAGYGLAQWTYYSRKQNLLNYAKSIGASIGDLEMQLQFLIKELNGYSSISSLKNASSVLEASNWMLFNFERPADQSTSVQNRRASYGQSYYDKYASTISNTTQSTGGANMTAIEKIIQIAEAEVGYLEKTSNSNLDSKTGNAGSNNYTKYARDLYNAGYYNGNKNGYAWCDVFVDWCFYQAFGKSEGQRIECQTGELGAGCYYSAQYYKAQGRLDKTPKVGDQIFFLDSSGDVGHTGLVYKVDSSTVYTIEGNTSSASGVVANGGGVAKKSYQRSYNRIYAYGHPLYETVTNYKTGWNKDTTGWWYVLEDGSYPISKWLEINGQWYYFDEKGYMLANTSVEYEGKLYVFDADGHVTTSEIQTTPTEGDDDTMTYEQFKEYMNKYRKELQDNDAGNWSQEDRDWAISTGLIKGGDPLPDGTPNYMWADFLTREQSAALFHRFAQMIGK